MEKPITGTEIMRRLSEGQHEITEAIRQQRRDGREARNVIENYLLGLQELPDAHSMAANIWLALHNAGFDIIAKKPTNE